ncbi:MAG TPA: PIN domain-containing protein [Propionicimonas sp.]|nr:PIN domain-containing protein [Propionicimonas sp.]HQD95813.1 PIN domain-containing protein [Propionicimonas sp.]
MARYSAFLDACVLVPIALADTLLRLAEAGLYRPLWSDRVLDEVIDAIGGIHPELASGPARSRTDAMQSSFEGACVTDWEELVAGIALPDPDDRHVVAAALQGRADMIVTANVRDFPSEILEPMGLEVQHPDEFLLNQLDLEPDITIATLHRQADATRRPAITTKVLLEHLSRCGVPGFAATAAHQLWRAT